MFYDSVDPAWLRMCVRKYFSDTAISKVTNVLHNWRPIVWIIVTVAILKNDFPEMTNVSRICRHIMCFLVTLAILQERIRSKLRMFYTIGEVCC